MSPLLVGLTGGLAAGKSTVARLLREKGCFVVDADQLVRELYRPDEAGSNAIGEAFGGGVLDPEGGVDHRALARRVFSDPSARAQVEALIHPLVRERFAELAGARDGIVVLEATLLVEAGYPPDFDLVVTVEAEPTTRLERAIARGLGREDAIARLRAQGDGGERRAAADVVLHNESDLQTLEDQVDRLLDDWRAHPALKDEGHASS